MVSIPVKCFCEDQIGIYMNIFVKYNMTLKRCLCFRKKSFFFFFLATDLFTVSSVKV